ncbi:hypothetical protein TWF481_012202 [Arthrobotrys musiformis]|uniref:Uncharacterized protein n=1 Tax=Arthrobotrys musiformis TaxID=47236 RepID=A0AAV9VYS7_9PEZI
MYPHQGQPSFPRKSIQPPPGIQGSPRLVDQDTHQTRLPPGFETRLPNPQSQGPNAPQQGPQPTNATQKQSEGPDVPYSQAPPLMVPLQESRRQVEAMIAAMEEETKVLRNDKKYQDILFTQGLLYASCPNVWATCECEFCTQARYLRQYQDLDAIGSRIWNNPLYAYWRDFPGTHGVENCTCQKCIEAGKIVDVPEKLEPDWNLWYPNGDRPVKNPTAGMKRETSMKPAGTYGRIVEVRSKQQPYAPVFATDEEPQPSDEERAEAMLREYHASRGLIVTPLREMHNSDALKRHELTGNTKPNGIVTKGAGQPSRRPVFPTEQSDPRTPGLSTHLQYGLFAPTGHSIDGNASNDGGRPQRFGENLRPFERRL